LSPLLLYFLLLLFFIVLSTFFSAAETAFVAVNRLKIKYQAESGDRQAEAIHRIVSNPDRLLGVILLGVTVAEISAAGLATSIVTSYFSDRYVEIAGLVGSLVFAFIILIFCELTPKIVAATHPEKISRRLLPPVRFFIAVLNPFARMAAWMANGIVRLFGLNPTGSPYAQSLSEEELKAMIASSSEASVPDEKKMMLHNIFEIGSTQIREVMIPRGEVTAVDIGEEPAKILDIVIQTHYSRIPVYRGNFDNPIGILNVKDLLPYVRKSNLEVSIRTLLRPVHFVPDSARIDAVLRRLQSMHLHMAIVVDEYGGVEGIVTLEDLLEEIVGEIRDEHDTETEAVRQLGPHLYSVAGNIPVRDFNRYFDEKIPEAPRYATLAGFLESLTGRLLVEGETVRYEKLVLTIEKAEGFRIVTVRVRTSA
jgi:putative hemolysin